MRASNLLEVIRMKQVHMICKLDVSSMSYIYCGSIYISSAQFFACALANPISKPHAIVIIAYIAPSNLNIIGSIKETISEKGRRVGE